MVFRVKLPLPSSADDVFMDEEGVLIDITSPVPWGGTKSVTTEETSIDLPVREIETCGLAYFRYQLKRQAIEAGEAGSGGFDPCKRLRDEAEGEEEIGEGGEGGSDDTTFRFPKKTLTPKDVKKMDYYELLGLGHLSATEVGPDLLKKAYRKALLLYHPDKTGRGDRDEVFIEVQKAYETLSDGRKKRAYDSEMNFDESIPTGREKGDFFKVYGPVFDRNARFAVKRPVPNLGREDSKIEDVYRFYDYWGRFESWRDFSLKAAEENDFHVEAAGSREEKRWMQKENDKLARAMKKEEYKRLATLVERARTADPRLKRAKELEKEKKEAIKAARTAAAREREVQRRKDAEEETKKKEEEEARLKEERARAKLVRDQAKKRMRSARSRFRALCSLLHRQEEEAVGEETAGRRVVSVEEEDFMFEHVDVMGMEEAVAALEGVPYVYQAEPDGPSPPPARVSPAGVARVTAIVERERQKRREAKREEETSKAASGLAHASAEKDGGEESSPKEAAWTEEELGVLAKAVVRFPAGTQKRWQCIADYLNHMVRGASLRSKEECIKQYQVVQAGVSKSRVVAATGGAGAGGGSEGRKSGKTGTSRGEDNGKAVASGDGWSQEQQKQLEAGLVTYPASMEKNERWKRISEGVQGKSKKECAERYKALRAAVAKKKEEAAGAKTQPLK
ncbi:subfamily c member 2 protein [Nannochloropsis gaditana]|uniref:Subfamily c member 2 protein n=2 Tax=Nannochloropsis gaditana TaxID=72520 RepID=W7TYH1_9STRA|nr:subfamily c member 2 protein [Nannochloropsis gaditana]